MLKKDGVEIVLNMQDMMAVSKYYEIAGTQEFICENYDLVSEEDALEIATLVRDEMNALDSPEEKLIIECAGELGIRLRNSVSAERILTSVRKALNKYPAECIDVTKEAGEYYVIYHSHNNSFPVDDVRIDDIVDTEYLVEQLDKLSVGHCF